MSAKPQFNLIGIAVKDMATALAFYRELGLEIAPEMDSEGHVEVTLAGGIRLAWDTFEVIKSFDENWKEPDGHPQIGLAFLCDSPEDVNAQYERMVNLGYDSHKAPFDAFWGQRYAQISDPDGNIIDLFAAL